MLTEVWICGQWTSDYEWEFQGVYSSKEKAIAACRTKDYFIGPAFLDAEIPHEKRGWPNCEFPLSC